MKSIKYLSAIILIAFLLNSCGEKEAPRPDYNFSFKVNGVTKEFKANRDSDITFVTNQGTGNRTTIFTMLSGNDPSKNSISIVLRTNTSLSIGTRYEMQVPITVNNVVVPSIVFQYFDEDGKEYAAYLLKSANFGAGDDASIILSDFTDEGSFGLFEGVLFDVTDTSDLSQRTPLLITEGRFFLPNFIL